MHRLTNLEAQIQFSISQGRNDKISACEGYASMFSLEAQRNRAVKFDILEEYVRPRGIWDELIYIDGGCRSGAV
jgi:hypothetical protein